jgi:tetratricopeptide (TPR) repeat protein
MQATKSESVEECCAAGLEALEQGDLEAAEAWAGRCDAAAGEPADPRCAALRVDLGFARLMGGDAPRARAALERAAEMLPEDADIRIALAQVYEAVGEPARAADALLQVPPEALSPRLLGERARLLLDLERWNEAEETFRALGRLDDPASDLLAVHGQCWCRIRTGDWRGALDAALGATRLDRYDLTTAFLAYAKDRLFSHPADAARREAELGERLRAELREHADLHSGDTDSALSPGDTSEEEQDGH